MGEEFTLHEVLELKRIYEEVGKESASPVFCQQLARTFNLEPTRAKQPITWEQVQNWFEDRQKLSSKGCTFPHSKGRARLPPQKGKRSSVSNLTFEARSSKDNAWYDVASFVNFRVLCSGELEVRVRYAGYDVRDDEWVNVKSAVRERSIPLESAECVTVKVGDPVLCFQERGELASYHDARLVRIDRKFHDRNGRCHCSFWVRYDHDGSEEEVKLDRLCCRPRPDTENIGAEDSKMGATGQKPTNVGAEDSKMDATGQKPA